MQFVSESGIFLHNCCDRLQSVSYVIVKLYYTNIAGIVGVCMLHDCHCRLTLNHCVLNVYIRGMLYKYRYMIHSYCIVYNVFCQLGNNHCLTKKKGAERSQKCYQIYVRMKKMNKVFCILENCLLKINKFNQTYCFSLWLLF